MLLSLIFATTAFGTCWESCMAHNSYNTCMGACGSRGVAREARSGEEAFTCNQCMACKTSNCHQGAQDAICQDVCLEKCGTCFFEELCGDLTGCDACMADGRCVFDAAAGQCLFGATMTSRESWTSKENSFSWSLHGNMDFTTLVFGTAKCPAESPARSARQAGPIENYCEGNDCGEGMVCAHKQKGIYEVGSCYPGYCECFTDPANNARTVNDRLDSLLNKLERAVDGSQRQARGDMNCYRAKVAAGMKSGTAAFSCGFGRRR